MLAATVGGGGGGMLADPAAKKAENSLLICKNFLCSAPLASTAAAAPQLRRSAGLGLCGAGVLLCAHCFRFRPHRYHKK